MKLARPGVELYYETRGAGPVLLLIPGGNGDAASFGALPQFLADRFTVVAFDRRGFSRSVLDGPPDDERRLTDDVEDAVALLDLFPGPAVVLGSSSGAIVGLHLLARYPERVATLVAHEPPLISLLPDADRWLAAVDEAYATYQASGAEAAMAQFGRVTGLGSPPRPEPGTLPPHVVELLSRMQGNTDFFLEHELRQYVRLAPDLAVLAAQADRLVLASGRDSKEQLPYEPNQVLAACLGLPVVEFPGDHLGYLTHSEEFASVLTAAVKRQLERDNLNDLITVAEAEHGPITDDEIQAKRDLVAEARAQQGSA
jgi:pimeloyl-ACP methyl ester carboxylesterase